MKNNASVGEVDKPIWFVESESCQEIPRCSVPKSCIAKAPATEVEEGGNENGGHRRLLHSLIFRWRWLQSILHALQQSFPYSFSVALLIKLPTETILHCHTHVVKSGHVSISQHGHIMKKSPAQSGSTHVQTFGPHLGQIVNLDPDMAPQLWAHL